MVDTIPGSGKTREAFPIRFACDVPPDEGGPPAHKHTGTTYVVTPPKAALSLKLAVRTKTSGNDPEQVVAGIDEWMDRAFGRDVAAKLRERLTGPDEPSDDADDDPLDLPDVMAAMQFTTERTAGVPPT